MQKEIRIRKANKVLRVSENEVAKYIAIGYDVIDNKGNVVQASVPHDPNILQKAFIDNQATISALKDEIAQLRVAVAQLTAERDTLRAQADRVVNTTTKVATKSRSKRTE